MKRQSQANCIVNKTNILTNKELFPIPKDRILTIEEVEKILKERQISIFEDEWHE